MAATIHQNQLAGAAKSAVFKTSGGVRGDRHPQSIRKGLEEAAQRRPVIMVCLSSSDRLHEELLRKASRDAELMDADCYIVNVRVPGFHFGGSASDRRRAMSCRLRSMASSRVEVIFLKAHDVVRALLDFAWEARVGKIIIGRSRPGILHRLFSPAVTRALLSRVRDVEVEVVGYQRKINSSPRKSPSTARASAPSGLVRVVDFRKPEYSR